MNRLLPATPMASPIANDNPTVTVLLIAFLPRARPSEAIPPPYPPLLAGRGGWGFFVGVADRNCIVYRKPASLNYFAAVVINVRARRSSAPKPRTGNIAISCCFLGPQGIRGLAREGFTPCGEIPDSTAFAPLALPSPHTGCHEIRPMARASRRRVPRSKGNPACVSSVRASRRHSPECRWQSERGRRAAIRAQASQSCDLARTVVSNADASAMDRGRADPPGSARRRGATPRVRRRRRRKV